MTKFPIPIETPTEEDLRDDSWKRNNPPKDGSGLIPVKRKEDVLDSPLLIQCPFCGAIIIATLRDVLHPVNHYCECSDKAFRLKLNIEVIE